MGKLTRSGPAWVLGLFIASTVQGSSAQAPPQTFPFTAEENADGARFVWYVYNQTGFPFDYVPAKELPASKNFRPAPGNKPRAGDVAWWKDYVALYAGDEAPRDSNIRTAQGSAGLRELEERYGPVKWLRYREND
jgi:hypothetical protein